MATKQTDIIKTCPTPTCLGSEYFRIWYKATNGTGIVK